MSSAKGRTTRAFRQLRAAKSTWLLVRILLLVQAIPSLWNIFNPDGPDRVSQLQYLLGLNPHNAVSGQYWQFLSYCFIHGNWSHLLLNAAAILLLGSKLEHYIAKRSFWILAALSTFVGAGLFSACELLLPLTAGLASPTLVGSSAICFAFLLFLTTLSPESKFLPFFMSGRSIGICIIILNLFLTALNPNLPSGPLAEWGAYLSLNYSPDLFKVSHACHLGGSLVGFFYGKWLLRPRINLVRLRRAREKQERRAEASR